MDLKNTLKVIFNFQPSQPNGVKSNKKTQFHKLLNITIAAYFFFVYLITKTVDVVK